MITYACPDEQRLRDYLVGNLALADQEAVDDHLEFCPDCLAVVEGLDDVANSMFACLRQTSGSAVAQVDPEFLHLAKQVKELHGAPGWTQGREEKTVESAAGLVLGPYVLLRSIGAGGMGQVYQAEHQRMKRRVAVKLLSPEWLRSPLARARFQREIEAVARLSSPHIVAAYDAGESAGRDFLVMEYVEGRILPRSSSRMGRCPWRWLSTARCKLPAASNTLMPPASSIATSSRPTCWWTSRARSRSWIWAWPACCWSRRKS